MSRMKDSDDYLTARAANPWTGLISPSPGTQTPCTPDSPAEALSLRRRTTQQESPTHAVKRRPILAKANEGRKVSNGSARVPAVGGANHDDPQCLRTEVPDDSFIVHMPSAREPQPFAYPGYSADQIAAFEHYKVKARRVSSEGYDRRLFHDNAGADCSMGHDHVGAHHDCADPSHRPFTPYHADHHHNHHDHEPSTPEPPRLLVRKRENSKISRILHRGQIPRDQAPPSTNIITEGRSSPISGPRSPKPSSSSTAKDRAALDNQRSSNDNNVSTKSRKTAKHAEKVSVLDAGKAVLTHVKVCSNKPMKDSAPRRGADDHDQGSTCGSRSAVSSTTAAAALSPPELRSTSWDIASMPGAFGNLSQLPRVRLVKPEHAAVPRGVKDERRTGQKMRKCSLGCERDEQNGACVQRRTTSNATVIRSTSFFERTSPIKAEEKRAPIDYAEQFFTYTLLFIRYLGSLQLPRVGIVDILRDAELSTKDKTEALKAMFSLAGHALAVCSLVAIVWKLGTSVVILSRVIFWPLAVPLRVVLWIVIG
ncbi:hypothetical protein Slin14017_G035920 [Septoria linicola]|nr:hypothetical protein Slin14017_G035920 [Septoria linicola]